MSDTPTGAILAGGDSTRMGREKGLLPWGDGTLLDRVHAVVAPLCSEVLLVTRSERREAWQEVAPRGSRVLADRMPGRGPLVGIHAALEAAAAPRVLVVACDMPWLSSALLGAMIDEGSGQVVIPRGEKGYEPLHALYDRSCLPFIEARLERGGAAVASFFSEVTVDLWSMERCRRHDPTLRSFTNVNRPEDLDRT